MQPYQVVIAIASIMIVMVILTAYSAISAEADANGDHTKARQYSERAAILSSFVFGALGVMGGFYTYFNMDLLTSRMK